jgi:amino acid transporter
VSKLSTAARRLILGRPYRSDRLSHTLLSKRIALPVFASDALSSVAYAPEEIFLMLSVAGLAAYSLTPWIGLAVAAVMLVVVASYRQNVHAYPSGGGDFEVVTTNLGANAGLMVASALMVDYVLTVAVSTASAMSNIGSAFPFVADHKVLFAVGSVLLVMALNLRGIRESGARSPSRRMRSSSVSPSCSVGAWSGSTCSVSRCGRNPPVSECSPPTAPSSVLR